MNITLKTINTDNPELNREVAIVLADDIDISELKQLIDEKKIPGTTEIFDAFMVDTFKDIYLECDYREVVKELIKRVKVTKLTMTMGSHHIEEYYDISCVNEDVFSCRLATVTNGNETGKIWDAEFTILPETGITKKKDRFLANNAVDFGLILKGKMTSENQEYEIDIKPCGAEFISGRYSYICTGKISCGNKQINGPFRYVSRSFTFDKERYFDLATPGSRELFISLSLYPVATRVGGNKMASYVDYSEGFFCCLEKVSESFFAVCYSDKHMQAFCMSRCLYLSGKEIYGERLVEDNAYNHEDDFSFRTSDVSRGLPSWVILTSDHDYSMDSKAVRKLDIQYIGTKVKGITFSKSACGIEFLFSYTSADEGKLICSDKIVAYAPKIYPDDWSMKYAMGPEDVAETEQIELKAGDYFKDESYGEPKSLKEITQDMNYFMDTFLTFNREYYSLDYEPGTLIVDEEELSSDSAVSSGKYDWLRQRVNNALLPDSVCKSLVRAIPSSFLMGESFHTKEDIESLPNLMLTGPAGVGKTSLAKSIAENLFGFYFMPVSSSSLQGKYQGHTESEIARVISYAQEAAKKNSRKGTVIFIDEAYQLFGSDLEYSHETIGILLQLMSRQLKTIENSTSGNGRDRYKVDVEATTIFVLAGYEQEMLQALNNDGLFRRLVQINLPEAKNTDLYDVFLKHISGDETLMSAAEESKDKILKFFSWASVPERSKYFGGFGGAINLARRIKNEFGFYKGSGMDFEGDAVISDLISDEKESILRRYNIRANGNKAYDDFTIRREFGHSLDDYFCEPSLKQDISLIADAIVSSDENSRISKINSCLLMGPSGSGKSYLTECLLGEVQKNLEDESVAAITVCASEIVSADMVKKLFLTGNSIGKLVIFIDELEGIVSRPDVLSRLLLEMDSDENKVFVIGATNRSDLLTPSLIRRFDRTLEISGRMPKEDMYTLIGNRLGADTESDLVKETYEVLRGLQPARILGYIDQAFEVYCKTNRLLSELKEKGELNSSLDNRIRVMVDHRLGENGYLYTESDVLDVTSDTFSEMFIRDLKEVFALNELGRRSSEFDVSKFSLKRNEGVSGTAVHETGHAAMSLLLDIPIDLITVLPRNNTLGYVQRKSKLSLKCDYEKAVMIGMAGRIAEEIVFGEENISSGAVSDIKVSSELVRTMVSELGFDSELGFMNLMSSMSDTMKAKVDMRCSEYLSELYKRARGILLSYRNEIISMAETVFMRTEMTGKEFSEHWDGLTGNDVKAG